MEEVADAVRKDLPTVVTPEEPGRKASRPARALAATLAAFSSRGSRTPVASANFSSLALERFPVLDHVGQPHEVGPADEGKVETKPLPGLLARHSLWVACSVAEQGGVLVVRRQGAGFRGEAGYMDAGCSSPCRRSKSSPSPPRAPPARPPGAGGRRSRPWLDPVWRGWLSLHPGPRPPSREARPPPTASCSRSLP